MMNNNLLDKNAIYGFIYNGARFDEENTKRFNFLLENFHDEIKAKENIVVFFYTDDSNLSFSRKHLYNSEICNRIARLLSEYVVPIMPFKESKDNLRRKLHAIKRSSDPVIFHLGAGASKECGLPTGRDMLHWALVEYNKENPNTLVSLKDHNEAFFENREGLPVWLKPQNLTFEHVVSRLKDTTGNITELECIKKFIELNKESKANEEHKILVKFCKIKNNGIIITTNFDTVFENSELDINSIFRDGEYAVHSKTDPCQFLEKSYEDGKVPLIKLHGSIDDINSVVVTFERLEKLTGEKKTFMENLKNNLPQIGCIIPIFFIGYSLNDPDLKPYYEDLLENGFQPIIVSPELTPEMHSIGTKKYRNTDALIYNLDFKQFGDILNDILEEA